MTENVSLSSDEVRAKKDSDPRLFRELEFGLRLLVARYIYFDLLLLAKLGECPKCHDAYMDGVDGVFGMMLSDKVVKGLIGGQPKDWMVNTITEMVAKLKKYSKHSPDAPLSYPLVFAAASFDRSLWADDARRKKALRCFEEDLKILEKVLAFARFMK